MWMARWDTPGRHRHHPPKHRIVIYSSVDMENKVLCCFNNICWLCVRLRKLMNALHHPQQNESWKSWKSWYFRQTQWLDPEVHGNQMLYLYLWPVWQRNEKCQRENNKHSVWRNFAVYAVVNVFISLCPKWLSIQITGQAQLLCLLKTRFLETTKKNVENRREHQNRTHVLWHFRFILFFFSSFVFDRQTSITRAKRNTMGVINHTQWQCGGSPAEGKLSKAARIF